MRFDNPEFLWGILAVPFLAALFVLAWRRRAKMAQRFASASMLARIATTVNPWVRITKLTLILASLVFLFLALARPQWGRKMELVERQGLDILLVQDISLSMLAQDIQPSRLIRSKHEISGFLENLKGDRVGLVAFSGEARILCPLTLDYGAVRIFLNDLEPGYLLPGTDIAGAMETGIRAFAGAGSASKYQVMVLLTDGEEHDARAVQEAEKAASLGITVYTVGIGSRAGVPIPVPDKNGNTQYKKDRNGNIVTTHLEEATLQEIASKTGGRYYYAGPGEFQLQKVLEDISTREKQNIEGQHLEQYQDRYQWPLGLAFALLVLESLVSDRARKKTKAAGRYV
ncbi:MAG TPA: VWA domain-containing protein [Fibrobacteraceae bacterium]|nr:VWA domain-containing protein [Fibrobacteraceae bacterium]